MGMHGRGEEFLDHLSDEAYERLSQAGDDARRLPEPYRTVALVHAAQGVIDNGGLTYLFENDWPHNPPYSVYADAYERIGRVEAARALRDAAASFPLRQPELHCTARGDFMEMRYDAATMEIKGWNDCICGDKKVFVDLVAWARKQLG